MTQIHLVENGRTLWKGDLGEWQHKPPTAIQHLIQKGRKNEPYMQAALAALLEAHLKQVDTVIEATTEIAGWSLRVTHKVTAGAS